MPELDRSDIQGNILKGYRYPVARYVFVRVDDAAQGRQFVGELANHVTTSEAWEKDESGKVQKLSTTLNMAFTYKGLAALKVPARLLLSFPIEFQQGMHARARILGDIGESAPQHWDAIWTTGEVHIWLSIHALDPAADRTDLRRHRLVLKDRYDWLSGVVAKNGGVTIVGSQDAGTLGANREHFGFADGLSNPDVDGFGTGGAPGNGKLTPDGGWAPLATGEFLLGYTDEGQETPPAPWPHLLARNGTYMVYRKLHQNIASFRRYLDEQAKKLPGGEEAFQQNKEWLAAKMVGRWRNGTPLELSPDKPWSDQEVSDAGRNNDFRYEDDANGARCPVGAHIRRMNPRDSMIFSKLADRRRIIRRGLPYGDPIPDDQPGDDDGEHGVVFMALNAGIERQFEFIQTEWVNYGNDFKQGNDKDPIAGNHDGKGKMIVQGDPSNPAGRPPMMLARLPRFVTTRGGDYFFLPSLTALRKIADDDLDETQERSADMSFLDYLKSKFDAFAGELKQGAKDPRKEVMDAVEAGFGGIQQQLMEFLDRLKQWAAENPEKVFAILRKIKPILLVRNFAIVTRFEDVQEVLARDAVFLVTYRDKMEALTQGHNFFLGMQNTPEYTRDVSNMRIVARRDDVPQRIVPFVDRNASEIVAQANGRLDVVAQLTKVVATRTIGDYFGTPGANEQEFADWATKMFQFLFIDQNNDPAVRTAALAAAEKMRNHLDAAIAARKPQRGSHDDVLERCLQLQDAGVPGMDDLHIRNNLFGLLVGAIPTTSKAATHALDQLLDRPDQLAKAQAAAQADNNGLAAQYVFEALRFHPINPGLFRVAAQDYVVAKGENRERKIPKGTLVLAATQSAMFDDLEIDAPHEFRIDRPDYHYLHYGYGLHTCFGQYINQVQIPRIVAALLKKNNLRRAPGDAGKLKNEGPFPVSMTVEFDP